MPGRTISVARAESQLGGLASSSLFALYAGPHIQCSQCSKSTSGLRSSAYHRTTLIDGSHLIGGNVGDGGGTINTNTTTHTTLHSPNPPPQYHSPHIHRTGHLLNHHHHTPPTTTVKSSTTHDRAHYSPYCGVTPVPFNSSLPFHASQTGLATTCEMTLKLGQAGKGESAKIELSGCSNKFGCFARKDFSESRAAGNLDGSGELGCSRGGLGWCAISLNVIGLDTDGGIIDLLLCFNETVP